MARSPRGQLPAGSYHITIRSAGQVLLFVDDADRTLLCTLLVRAMRRQRWTCHAFCLMPTHYHLVLETPHDSLQAGMHLINGLYARTFNKRHRRTGHLFGERYYHGPIESDGHMLHSFRYVARNPVEAGLCDRPSDWYWGSYRSCAGGSNDFPFVDSSRFRDYFSGGSAPAIELLREFVGDE